MSSKAPKHFEEEFWAVADIGGIIRRVAHNKTTELLDILVRALFGLFPYALTCSFSNRTRVEQAARCR